MSDSQRLGKCQILGEIGRGGFATVFRVLDTMLEREVALKVLKSGWTDDPKAVERFMREARVASRLDHPASNRLDRSSKTYETRLLLTPAPHWQVLG